MEMFAFANFFKAYMIFRITQPRIFSVFINQLTKMIQKILDNERNLSCFDANKNAKGKCLLQIFPAVNKVTKNFAKTIFIILLSVTCNSLIVNGQSGETAKNQTTAEASILQAEQLLKQGKTAEAVEVLRSALIKYPADGNLNFRLGKIFYRQGKYQEAIEKLTFSLTKLEKTSSEYKDAAQMLGLSHYVSGHLAESIPYLEQVIKWSPENNEITYALGISYIQTRQPVNSREIYARLFGVATNSAAAYLINAQMHVRQRFEETAEIELNQALKLDPKLPQANFVLGELAIYKAEIDKGIEYLNKEIAINPSNGMAYYRLGEALTRQLKWDEAVPSLQKSIWLNPFFSGPYIVLGKVYFKKRELGNAENVLRRAVEMDPNNFGAHYLLAQTLQQSGKLEESKTEFALAEKLRGNAEKEP
jgi:tetratricopeptide (TPR) repeat protein